MAFKNLFKTQKAKEEVAVEPAEKIGIVESANLVPNVVGMTVFDAINLLQKYHIAYEFDGFKEIVPKNIMEGTVKNQILISNTRKVKVLRLYISMDKIK